MTPKDSSSRALQIGLSRLQQRLGWASLLGISLGSAAIVITLSAWASHQSTAHTLAPAQSTRAAAPAALQAPATSGALSLPPASELPALLARLESVAIANHLGWAAAEYRMRPASEREPASMEIRTRFIGSYPQIRQLVTQAVERIPTLTFRELNLARANTSTGDVEARIVFAILHADEPAARVGPAHTEDRPQGRK